MTAPKSRSMKAVQITQDHSIRLIETGIPSIKADEVLVKPCSCGICGTDLHILHHGFPGTAYPVIPGHEFAGHIVEIGRDVTGLKEGDFVAVDPNVTCGTCRWCTVGRPNLCETLTPIGVGRPGAAADYVAAPARNSFTVDESLGGDVAAMIEPLACVLHAVASSQGVTGKDVLVFGGGTMGLLTAMASRLRGADRVVLVDPAPGKRAIATAAGVPETMSPADLGRESFDVVFEAAGARPAVTQAFDLVRKTGVLVQVGVLGETEMVPFSPFRIYERELTIVGSNSCADKFPEAVEVMSDIAEQVRPLIDDSHLVWDFEAAVGDMAKGLTIKTQLHF